MRLKYCLVFMLILLNVNNGWAESEKFPKKSRAEKIRNYSDARDYNSILSMGRDECYQFIENSTKSTMTIYQRAANAEKAVQCVEKFQAEAATSVSTVESRVRINELFQPLNNQVQKTMDKAQSEVDFMGLNWGVGFGYSYGFDESIDDAEIVNGVVRVKSRKKEQARAVLEFHKYFWLNDGYKDGTQGCGPFVALAAKDDKLLSGVGIGIMYGKKAKATDSDGFSIGIGILLDNEVKDLADGFKENEEPPEGETSVRFEEKSRWSGLFFVTRTF